MAKGDEKRSRNRIDYGAKRGEQLGTNLREGTLLPLQQQMWNNYSNAVPRQMEDYGNLMGQYNQFAQTGGFSPQDLGAIRARALSPTRAAYTNAQRNVNRQRALQGGYAPGFGTLQARMAREQGQGLSDAATNAEAAIAQMVQQGKLAGLGGAANLYGTTPAMAATFGNQVLGSTGLLSRGVENEMDFLNRVSGLQIGASQIPGVGDVALNRIGQISDMVRDWTLGKNQ